MDANPGVKGNGKGCPLLGFRYTFGELALTETAMTFMTASPAFAAGFSRISKIASCPAPEEQQLDL